jgi:hypothetical protein
MVSQNVEGVTALLEQLPIRLRNRRC